MAGQDVDLDLRVALAVGPRPRPDLRVGGAVAGHCRGERFGGARAPPRRAVWASAGGNAQAAAVAAVAAAVLRSGCSAGGDV